MKWNMLIGSLVLGASLCTPSFGGGLLDHMLGLKGAGCDSACCDTGCAADPSCGCELACEPSCGIETACGPANGCCEPACAAPTCGCEMVGPSCGVETACGGCDTGCGKARRRPLRELLGHLDRGAHRLFGKHHGCDSGCADLCGAPSCGCEIAACDPCGAAPSCGCEISACAPSCGIEAACDPCGCDSGCGGRKHCGGLLAKLFHRKGNRHGCDTLACDSGCASGCNSYGHVNGNGSSAPVAAPKVNGDAAPMPPAPVVDPSAYLQSNRRVIQATSYVR